MTATGFRSQEPSPLEMRDVTVRLGGLAALDRFSLTVNEREIVALAGPNGAGKTTVLDSITGLRPLHGGWILLQGVNIAGRRPHAIASLGVARTFQSVALFETMTVRQHVEIGLQMAPGQGDAAAGGGWRLRARRPRAEVEGVLEALGLGILADTPVAKLSGGQRRRTDIARALAGEPRLLLLDEPAAGLDAAQRATVATLLAEWRARSGASIILIEHDATFVKALADRVVLLKSGRVVSGSAAADTSRHFQRRAGRPGAEEPPPDGARVGHAGRPSSPPATPVEPAALAVTGLSVRFGAVEVLAGVSLTVASSRITAVVGGNASGKTTLLRAIAGLVPVAGGTVTLRGKALQNRVAEEVVRMGVALAPQNRGTFLGLTVADNLRLGGITRPRAESGHDLARVLNLFPALADRLGQKGGTLSGGEQQMLAIGRALMSRPAVLLLDEPTAGLSEAVIADLTEALVRMRGQGVAVLIAEHNAAFVAALADQVLTLANGRATTVAVASSETA